MLDQMCRWADGCVRTATHRVIAPGYPTTVLCNKHVGEAETFLADAPYSVHALDD